jgi:acetylornithine/succinyldiaminopimelate/putrescine aminotransferase
MDINYFEDTQELLAQAKKSVLFTAVRPDIVMERGQGMYLWDTNGKNIWTLLVVGLLHH